MVRFETLLWAIPRTQLETLNALAKTLEVMLDQLLEVTEASQAEDVSKKDNALESKSFSESS